MDPQFELRRDAVAALVRAVLDRFAQEEGRPRFGPRADNWRWWRHGQEVFAGLERDAWVMPAGLPHYGWLDGFSEMPQVREAYANDPVLRERVDTMMGAEFNRTGTNFYWIVVQHVIGPLVVATRTYTFNDQAFDRIYQDFETRFRATSLHMVEFRPLNGFDSVEHPLRLPGGLVLQRMSDTQMSEAINRNAVPRLDGGGVNNARIHRYDQWALITTYEYPVVAGSHEASTAQPQVFPVLDEPAERLVIALRLVCGGSVVSTRSISAQADGEFPFVPSGTALLNAFTGADNDRPTILYPAAVDALREIYGTLGLPQVRADKSLQVAIRRLVYAGSRTLGLILAGSSSVSSDRIIDLMTCAEALFLKRTNQQSNAKGAPVARAAAAMLADDPELNTDGEHIKQIMMTAYRARNAEVHGDEQPYRSLNRLSGAPTAELADVVADVEHIMRRAIITVLTEHMTPPIH